MNILVTGANGQLGNEMRIVSQESKDKYIFTDVAELDITNMEAIRTMVKEEDVKIMSPLKSAIAIVVGVACIIIGGKLVVYGASEIAAKFGMSENLIGMTIVAIGTSLPELVTSMVAAKKGESDLALGNAIGSNIFNIVFILGASALIAPMTVDILSVIDTIAVIGVSALVLAFSATGKKINRAEGGIMVGTYIAYFVYMLMR
jgi:cation:H+ antiporter